MTAALGAGRRGIAKHTKTSKKRKKKGRSPFYVGVPQGPVQIAYNDEHNPAFNPFKIGYIAGLGFVHGPPSASSSETVNYFQNLGHTGDLPVAPSQDDDTNDDDDGYDPDTGGDKEETAYNNHETQGNKNPHQTTPTGGGSGNISLELQDRDGTASTTTTTTTTTTTNKKPAPFVFDQGVHSKPTKLTNAFDTSDATAFDQ